MNRTAILCIALCASALLNARAAPSHWQYAVQPSPMGDATLHMATITSTNVVDLGDPYGKQRVKLTLVHGRVWAASLSMASGQFMCQPDGCDIRVRFDKGQARSVESDMPYDGSLDSLVVHHADHLARDMAGAHTMLIEATYYQAGSQIARFNVSGFDPKRM